MHMVLYNNSLLVLIQDMILVMGKTIPIRGGHFLTLKATAVIIWKTQRLPFEMVHQVLMAIEPTTKGNKEGGMSPIKNVRGWATACEQIRQHISDYQWGPLAQQICHDLKELLNVAPILETAAKYEKFLDEYFDVMSRDDPQHWFPNEKSASSGLAREKKRAQK